MHRHILIVYSEPHLGSKWLAELASIFRPRPQEWNVQSVAVSLQSRWEEKVDLHNTYLLVLPQMDEDSRWLSGLSTYEGIVVGNAVLRSLAELVATAGYVPKFELYGMNMWPGFQKGRLREMSRLSSENAPPFEQWFDWNIQWVDDRVGMVMPRLLAMIINEAFYTVQEGTATADAIDTAMKLGTNYPGGPFEWVDKIGLTRIYRLLERLWEDTRDPRYRLAPLMRRQVLQQILSGSGK